MEGASRKLFDYKTVCTFFGIKDPLLADKVNTKKIECMGHEFLISKFCENKFKNNLKYTKSRFDIASKNVACHFSETVTVSIHCDEKHKKYCEKPKNSCLMIKKDFAYGHELIRSFTLEMFPPILKCFYSSKSKIDIPEEPAI